ncbi:glycosyltransferase [Brasilonema sp. UFV-L1]|uniref:glycosyltransferase family 2 protein n=1 Tax=Brasilonema sp. UFV-L1 TaxID=2234130 RepID=UPI00145DFCDC|nr:glycosyltransferase [Brasilonema sp. UFV-L1]NMG06416.1 glycosyltransferase family 2 protein [Brasilonema sp. UFV-L1]
MKVSIIISNYNYARYLPSAIESVIAQTYKNTEIIVVDDGSKDDSCQVLLQLSQKYPNKIKAIFQVNQGQGAAFNTGFGAASGDIIAFLDADDVWKPNKLQRIIEIFQNSDVVGVMHFLENIDSNGKPIKGSIVGKSLDDDLARIIVETGNAWCFPPTSGLAYRRDALQKVFPIDSVKWRLCVDGCLIYCTAFLGKIKTLDEVLGSYRIHGANHYVKQQIEITTQVAKSQAGIEMTNQCINEYLESINHPYRVDLSRNLQYQRTNYYTRGKWNIKDALAISNLILRWRFYNQQEQIYYFTRFWMKNIQLLFRQNSDTKTLKPS